MAAAQPSRHGVSAYTCTMKRPIVLPKSLRGFRIAYRLFARRDQLIFGWVITPVTEPTAEQRRWFERKGFVRIANS